VTAGETLVSVAEGQVVLTAQERSVTVAAGEQTMVQAGQAPAPPEPMSDEERTLWAIEGEMPEMAPPTSTPTYTPTTGTEYIISGGPGSNAEIFVDDILRVFVNSNLVTEVQQGGHCCPPVPSIHFVANTGDVLRVQAQDANACYSLDALWLQKADGSGLTQLTGDIAGPNCNSEPPEQIFFDQTFTLP
jgi:hypothetical protein